MEIVKPDTDHERMAAVARGDLSSMDEIYQNRHRPLFRFFFRLTSRQATAEDLVHEVFLRMIRYRHTYQMETDGEKAAGAFEAWMYRIAPIRWPTTPASTATKSLPARANWNRSPAA